MQGRGHPWVQVPAAHPPSTGDRLALPSWVHGPAALPLTVTRLHGDMAPPRSQPHLPGTRPEGAYRTPRPFPCTSLDGRSWSRCRACPQGGVPLPGESHHRPVSRRASGQAPASACSSQKPRLCFYGELTLSLKCWWVWGHGQGGSQTPRQPPHPQRACPGPRCGAARGPGSALRGGRGCRQPQRPRGGTSSPRLGLSHTGLCLVPSPPSVPSPLFREGFLQAFPQSTDPPTHLHPPPPAGSNAGGRRGGGTPGRGAGPQ